jgi:hypothetical protein
VRPIAPLLVALFATTAAAAPDTTSTLIAVPELVPLGVPAEMAQNLTAVIAAELGRYDHVRVLSSREMALLLGLERQKELLGCSDDSCVSQLAGALGADEILGGQIGTIEQSVVFTLQLTNAKTARVDGRVVKVVPAGKNQIVDAVRAAVTSLMGTASSRNQLPKVAVSDTFIAHQHETLRLDASRCYDPDGDPLQTEWRQLDGPPAVLEGAHEATATFVATEVGHYTFGLSVTDGRSAPVTQSVAVEVRRSRPFMIGIAAQVFAPFNRYVLSDGAGGDFRNRTPSGPKLDVGLSLNEHWQLIGTGELSFMHTFTLDSPQGPTLDYTAFSLLAGLRFNLSFGAFKLFAQATIGSSRLFLRLQQDGNVSGPGAQALIGELGGGVDLPLNELFGLAFSVGMRVQGNTEPVPQYPGFSFAFSPGGLFWGLQCSAGPYVRL